jgi:Zn-dependent protease with chaperone function
LTRNGASDCAGWRAMRSLRLGYLLFAMIALAGAGAVSLGLGLAVDDVRLTDSPAAVAAACWRFVFPTVSARTPLVLALGSLGIAVIMRGVSSGARQARSSHRLLRRQQPVRALRIAEHRAIVLRGSSVQAFTGGLLRPRVYLSEGALARLDGEQLTAVVAHEAHHARRRDPLRLFLARVATDALFFLPVLVPLRESLATQTELAADAAAVHAGGGARPLARALLAFDAAPTGSVGIAPERVDELTGYPARLELPLALIATAIITIVFLVAIALQLRGASTGRDDVNPAGLLEQLCLVLKALLPLVVGAALILRAAGRRPD